MKTALVLGATGTIGHQLCKRLKSEGYWVRAVDRKVNEYSDTQADELHIGDLRDEGFMSHMMFAPNQRSESDTENSFDECYALMAEMGGAGYVFSKDNDAEIIHNSAIMNLHCAHQASLKKVKKVFFSSSACCYSERLQLNTSQCDLRENTAWDGKPDSVYGIEKLFSEQVYDSYRRNFGLNVRIARFHNIFSEEGCWNNGREKAPSALCRKVAEAENGGEIEIWGDGLQTRSFLYCQEALDGVRALMNSEVFEPLNIGSDEMISINDLALMIIGISGKDVKIKNVPSNALGVRGRNSNNELIFQKIGWKPELPLKFGIWKLYHWINEQVKENGNGNVQ